MITVTEAAAEQILNAARQGKMEGMALRVSVNRQSDGSFQYAMGFDDTGITGDPSVSSNGVEVVVAEASVPHLSGTTIDYVEFEPGQYKFIFINPNDPAHRPPVD